MFGVERTGPGRSEAGANRPKSFDGAAEFETLDPNRCGGPLSRGEDGPHVRAQGVDRTLKVFQPRWGRGGARKAGVDVVEQTAERNQLLGKRLIRHRGVSIEEGAAERTAHQLRRLR
jgi:hypothetical protein